MPTVNIPNVGVVNFPEGMTPEDIQRAIETDIIPNAPQAAAAAPERVASAGDRALGSVPGRFALGASQLLTGPAQLGANIGSFLSRNVVAPIAEAVGAEDTARYARNPDYDVGRVANATMQVLEESKQRGMKAHGKEGVDWAGLAGSGVGGVGALKGIEPAVTVMGKIGQGAAIGAGFGAATPVTSDEDTFFAQKALQTGTGAVVGAAIPAATETVKALGRAAKDVSRLVTPSGPEKIATKFQREIVGDGQMQPVIDRLRNIAPTVPGSKPTAAEALAGLPEGSPLVAHQKVTAETAGGISARFGQQKLDEQAARAAARGALNARTGPMRQAALDAANVKGIDPHNVTARISAMMKKPGWRANPLVQRVLGSIESQIDEVAPPGSAIDANDLYEIRKLIGNTIKLQSKETANWDKKLSAGLQKDIQHAIDDAIEAAGGTGWKAYLAVHSAGMKGIDLNIVRAKEALKPLQRTALAGSSNVTGEVTATIPQLLSRPAMIANWVLKQLGYNVEPRVDAVMAERYLNPSLLADALEQAPQSQRAKIMTEMWKQYGRAATLGAPVTAIAELEGE